MERVRSRLRRGESAGETARTSVANLIGADPSDVALIASVSAAAGLVAAQFGPAQPGNNVVIGEREYSSNHFPWRMLEYKGYEVRQVPFRNGGLEPDDVARSVDGRTVLVAFSAVQTATGHRSDIAALSAIAREVGALVFVDGSQFVGALPVAEHLPAIDVLATADHKFLMHAGRGLGYCYLSPATQARFLPTNAGWKAGRVPVESFFGPTMDLSPTASRFDNSISWTAAIGNVAALSAFDEFGADAIYAAQSRVGRVTPVGADRDRARAGGSAGSQPQHDRGGTARQHRARPTARATSSRKGSWVRPETATSGCRSISTTTRTTSRAWRARSPMCDVRPLQLPERH